MNIEQIMKPYFNKTREIENLKETNKSLLEQKEIVALRLERIRDNKKSEIDEYLQNEFLEHSNFLGYEAVKKDLESEYLLKEKSLEDQIKEIETEIENNENKARKFYNVDIRELVEIKEAARKKLVSLQKETKQKLEEFQLEFNTIMFRLSNFKYIYDENHIVQNGEEYKRLFDESHKLIDEIKLIEKQLKEIDENLSLTQLTNEEIDIIMRGMTPLEKAESDRRKIFNYVGQTNLLEKTNGVLENLEEKVEETVEEKVEETKEVLNIQEYDENIDYEALNKTEEQSSDSKEESLTEEDLIRECSKELIDEVYNDIINSAKEINKVDGNMIGLSPGLYLSESDMIQAVKKYYKKNKGRTYTVERIKKGMIITRDSIKNLKKALKKCVAVNLTREGKSTSFDLKRVFVQKEIEEIENQANQPEEEIYSENPSGRYIEEQSFINALPNLFQIKQESWIEKMVAKMKSKRQARKENKNKDYDSDYGYGFYSAEEMYMDEMYEDEIYNYDDPVKRR